MTSGSLTEWEGVGATVISFLMVEPKVSVELVVERTPVSTFEFEPDKPLTDDKI